MVPSNMSQRYEGRKMLFKGNFSVFLHCEILCRSVAFLSSLTCDGNWWSSSYKL